MTKARPLSGRSPLADGRDLAEKQRVAARHFVGLAIVVDDQVERTGGRELFVLGGLQVRRLAERNFGQFRRTFGGKSFLHGSLPLVTKSTRRPRLIDHGPAMVVDVQWIVSVKPQLEHTRFAVGEIEGDAAALGGLDVDFSSVDQAAVEIQLGNGPRVAFAEVLDAAEGLQPVGPIVVAANAEGDDEVLRLRVTDRHEHRLEMAERKPCTSRNFPSLKR
jgi:hypothetical protein